MSGPTCDPKTHPSPCACCEWRLTVELPDLRSSLAASRKEVEELRARINTLETDGGIWHKSVYKARAEAAEAKVAALEKELEQSQVNLRASQRTSKACLESRTAMEEYAGRLKEDVAALELEVKQANNSWREENKIVAALEANIKTHILNENELSVALAKAKGRIGEETTAALVAEQASLAEARRDRVTLENLNAGLVESLAELRKRSAELVRLLKRGFWTQITSDIADAVVAVEALASPPSPAPVEKECVHCAEPIEDHYRPCGNCGDKGHAKWECVLLAPVESKPKPCDECDGEMVVGSGSDGMDSCPSCCPPAADTAKPSPSKP